VKEEDFNIDAMQISKAEKEYEAEMLKTQIDRSESSVNVETEVIKPATFKRINEKQQTHLWDKETNGNVCKNCYWFYNDRGISGYEKQVK
jgi:hypothetical protein